MPTEPDFSHCSMNEQCCCDDWVVFFVLLQCGCCDYGVLQRWFVMVFMLMMVCEGRYDTISQND